MVWALATAICTQEPTAAKIRYGPYDIKWMGGYQDRCFIAAAAAVVVVVVVVVVIEISEVL